MTRVYFVSHAEAQGNNERIFQGITDGDITENGYKQLEALKKRFEDIKLDAIYSSDLKRTVKTAQAVKGNKPLEIIKVPKLREINGGKWEGRFWYELPELFPKEAEKWVKDFASFRAPEGESVRELYDRATDTILGIVKENSGKTIAIVTHGTVLRVFHTFLRCLDFKECANIEWCDNTAVTLAEFDESLTPTIIFENDNSHLGDLSTFKKQKWWKDNTIDDQKIL